MSSQMPNTANDRQDRTVASYGQTSGVLVPRVVAYVVDLFIVGVLSLVVWISVGFLGLITFGLGWLLLPIVGICTAMAYAAITIGGINQATIGMRVSGVEVERSDGGPPDGISAAAHCLLFYVATFTVGLLVVNLLISLLRSDRRMGHDLLTGLVIVRS
jgi:uncharacterized RDD family membrane protein YckC